MANDGNELEDSSVTRGIISLFIHILLLNCLVQLNSQIKEQPDTVKKTKSTIIKSMVMGMQHVCMV